MPIRTNRGRAAVYRRLWGWPMRSPTHLMGTIILVAALMIAAGMLVPRLLDDGGTGVASADGPESTADSAPVVSDTGADPTLDREVLPTRLSEPLATPTSAKPAPEALRVAKRWVTAWVTPPEDGSVDSWLEGLRPHTTEEFLPQLRTVDPANIPATKVVGEPEVHESYTSSVQVEVATDGPTLLVTVIETDTGWRVTDYSENSG
jgi:hypothetical protein